jgi:hypothetical protein
MKLQSTIKKLFGHIVNLSILGTLVLFINLEVLADGGFGVSGTFAGYHYKLVPGEQIDSENIYASFVNNYDVEIEIDIIQEAPDGVNFLIDESRYQIQPGEIIRVPIGISLDNSVIPGDYVVRIFAQVVPGQVEGITVVGSAGLNARLSVFGEAGRVTIRSRTTSGDPFNAVIELFRIEEDGRLFSVATKELELSDRVVVGDYVAKLYFDGRTIGEELFTVNNNDNLIIDLVARTVFVRNFTVDPQFFQDRNILSSVFVTYSLENIYETINNIKLDLVVTLDGEIIDEVEMFLAPVLNPGRTEGRYTFIPSQGWAAGIYEISISLYEVDERFADGQFLYDTTAPYQFEVPDSIIDGGINILAIALIVIGTLLIGLLATVLYVVVKNKKVIQSAQ